MTGDDPTHAYELHDLETGEPVEDGAKLPEVSRWTPDGHRACDAGERAGADDVLRCPKRATVQFVYLVLKPKQGTRDSAFCKVHEDAGLGALIDAAERGEVLPAMKMRQSPRGFRRGV